MNARQYIRQLGQSVEAARLDKGMSQRELARLSGVGRMNVRYLEAGTSDPKLSTVYRVAGALGCTLAALMPAPIDEPPETLDDVATAMLDDATSRR